jgi:CheY-like chemotaxis protein
MEARNQLAPVGAASSSGQTLQSVVASERKAELSADSAAVKVLVADDQQDFAHSLARLLGVWGHETQIAANVYAVLETAEFFRPDIVLMDIDMPGLDGREACRSLRRTDWGVGLRIIAVSGRTPEPAGEGAVAAGFDFSLQKPVDVNLLKRLIASLSGGCGVVLQELPPLPDAPRSTRPLS